MLTDHLRVSCRDVREVGFDDAEVVFLLQHVVAVVDESGDVDAVVFFNTMAFGVVDVRGDCEVRMHDRNQTILAVPGVGGDAAAWLFNRQLISIGIISVSRDAGEFFTGQQPVRVVVGVGDDPTGVGIGLRQNVPGRGVRIAEVVSPQHIDGQRVPVIRREPDQLRQRQPRQCPSRVVALSKTSVQRQPPTASPPRKKKSFGATRWPATELFYLTTFGALMDTLQFVLRKI